MKCSQVRGHLDAYVDGEFDAQGKVLFDLHLDACAACRVSVQEALAMKHQVRAAMAVEPASKELRDRLIGLSGRSDSVRDVVAMGAVTTGSGEQGSEPRALASRSLVAGSFFAAAAAVGLVLWQGGGSLKPVMGEGAPSESPGVGSLPSVGVSVTSAPAGSRFVGSLSQGTVTPDRAPQGRIGSGSGVEPGAFVSTASKGWPSLLRRVVHAHSMDVPVDVPGEHPEKVAGFFRGKVEFPVRLAHFRGTNARFLGARLTEVGDRQGATLYYDVAGRRVTVLVFANDRVQGAPRGRVEVGGREIRFGEAGGYTVPVYQNGAVSYAFTGDMDREGLLRLAASSDWTVP